MALYVQAMTETCPKREDGKHSWGGHGDPSYLWCFSCQQEKPSNKEFMAYVLDENYSVIARSVINTNRLIWELVDIQNGEKVHPVKPLEE